MLPLLVMLAADWTRFGGPHGDFRLAAGEAALSWPAAGPRQVWVRELGDGYSSILVAGPRLYTMYRRADHEVVVALDAQTGATLWEYRYAAPLPANFDYGNGDGPRATPLLVNGKLYTAGATGRFLCLDAANGEVRWAKDAVRDFRGSVRNSGYAPSPVAWGDTVIYFPGGPGAAIVALRQSDGSVAWQRHDDVVSYATPRLVTFAGREMLLTAFSARIAALDPANGEVLWAHPHENNQQVNAMLPLWHPDGILFYSSGYTGHSAAAAVAAASGAFPVRELWSHKRVRAHFSNAVLLGETVYVASGDLGPAPLAALDLRTGTLRWRDRTLARAAPVAVDGKLLLLDEDGVLALASPGESGLVIEGKAQILTNPSWTPPTVSGQRVYVRDRKRIAALAFD